MPDASGTAPSTTPDRTLSVLARADAGALKALAETVIHALGDIEVRHSRTGLVMLPMRDTVKGGAFHLGEVLVAEAHITACGVEGYGLRRGRDLEAAMAMALVDLAGALGVEAATVSAFVETEAARLDAEDAETLCDVEATRVSMETF